MHTLTFDVVIPDWVTHIAQDANGDWYGYSCEPAYTEEIGQGRFFVHDPGRNDDIVWLCKSPPPEDARTTLYEVIL